MSSVSKSHNQSRSSELTFGNNNQFQIRIFHFNSFAFYAFVTHEGNFLEKKCTVSKIIDFIQVVPLAEIIADYVNYSSVFNINDTSVFKDRIAQDLSKKGIPLPTLDQVKKTTALVLTSPEDIGLTLTCKNSGKCLIYTESFLIPTGYGIPKYYHNVVEHHSRDSHIGTISRVCDTSCSVNDYNFLFLPLKENGHIDEANAAYLEIMPDNGAICSTFDKNAVRESFEKWQEKGDKATDEVCMKHFQMHKLFNQTTAFLSFLRERHFEKLKKDDIHPNILKQLQTEVDADPLSLLSKNSLRS